MPSVGRRANATATPGSGVCGRDGATATVSPPGTRRPRRGRAGWLRPCSVALSPWGCRVPRWGDTKPVPKRCHPQHPPSEERAARRDGKAQSQTGRRAEEDGVGRLFRGACGSPCARPGPAAPAGVSRGFLGLCEGSGGSRCVAALPASSNPMPGCMWGLNLNLGKRRATTTPGLELNPPLPSRWAGTGTCSP